MYEHPEVVWALVSKNKEFLKKYQHINFKEYFKLEKHLTEDLNKYSESELNYQTSQLSYSGSVRYLTGGSLYSGGPHTGESSTNQSWWPEYQSEFILFPDQTDNQDKVELDVTTEEDLTEKTNESFEVIKGYFKDPSHPLYRSKKARKEKAEKEVKDKQTFEESKKLSFEEYCEVAASKGVNLEPIFECLKGETIEPKEKVVDKTEEAKVEAEPEEVEETKVEVETEVLAAEEESDTVALNLSGIDPRDYAPEDEINLQGYLGEVEYSEDEYNLEDFDLEE